MTVKEIEKLVATKVEQIIKQFQKIAPSVIAVVGQVQKNLRKIDVSVVTNKMKQVVDAVKSKMKALSNSKAKVKLEVSNEEAEKPISQFQKMINSLKRKVNSQKINLGIDGNEKSGQNKLLTFLNTFKGKLEQVKGGVSKFKEGFNQVTKATQPITNKIKKIGAGIISGVGSIIKFVAGLFEIKSIYNTLSDCTQSWLSSQDSGAQQLSANIEYLKNSIGGVFAPIIQTVVNLVYQLLKAIQSVVYAFSGVNIFAKSTANSMSKVAGSAGKTSKSLNGLHGEVNNVSDNNEGSSGDAGDGISADLDLSGVDMQMGAMAQKMYDFFNPLVVSWNTYGTGLIEQVKVTAGQIGGLISSVWGSFEKIITNGTVYSILGNILSIIGNIAEAYSNAWNYNGNGDAIIQGLADTLNNLLTAIDNVVQDEKFQEWLNICSEKIREIVEKLGTIDWQPLIDALGQIGSAVGTASLDLLKGLVDVFKWFVENPIVAEIIIGIALAIKTVITVVGLLTTAIKLLTSAKIADKAETFALALMYAKDFVVNLASATAALVKQIAQWVITTAMKVADTAATIANTVATTAATAAVWLFNAALTVLTSPITWIIAAIAALIAIIVICVKNWETIKETVTNVVNMIREKVSMAFNSIMSVISNVMNTVGNIISNVWNGIWSCIKGVINSILGGIEGMVNGVIRGVNCILSGASSIANAIGGLVGMKPISLKLNYISLPRLAKGNVAYSPIIAQFGEYSGASYNPEITAPQNILRETFEDVLVNHEWNSSNGKPIRVQIYWGTKNVVDEIIEGINEKTRQTGKAQIKVAYDY